MPRASDIQTTFETFNLGSPPIASLAPLYRQLNEIFTRLALNINEKPKMHVASAAPTSPADINAEFETGDLWTATSTNKLYCLTSRTDDTTVTWSILN